MNIDNRSLPPLVRVALSSALAGSTDKALRALAEHHPELARGFRPGKVDASVLRTRALAALERMHELPDAYRSLLRESTLSCSLISVLSEASLDRILDQLVTLHGLGPITASMLLDERETVRTRAFRLLDESEECSQAQDRATNVKPESHAGAATEFIARMTPFLEVLTEILTVADAQRAPIAADAPRITPKREPEQVRERQLTEALREKRLESARLQRDLERANASRERTTRELDARTRARDAATQRGAALEAELQTLRKRFDELLEAELARRLDARLLPWLLPAERLERIADEITHDDLCNAAEELLQHQADIDRRYGLRSRIQAEIERLEVQCKRLKSAQIDSLRPLPSLSSMVKRIEERVAGLRARLGCPAVADSDGLADSLERQIASAPTFARLAQARETLNSLASLDLMTEETQRRLHESIRCSASRLYAQTSMQHRWHPEPSAGAEFAGLTGVPLYALQAWLSSGKACTLVIDGHNVIFGLHDLFQDGEEPGAPGIRARMRLEQMLIGLGQKYPSLTIHLWFDGASLTDRTASENLRIHFSGGQGPDRADDRIAAYVRYLRETTPARTRAVVTADRDLAGRVQEDGAMVMTPIELGVWLETVN